ncbi:TonB-dependent receptor [Nitritalea halalkaliphila]|uniref:TonB-dependent receptor n=1 Tax=Nitritalea halalkaliphila TaxID=590849 RepID=UPI0002E413FE|nr:carboxypeptidase-like regulatory domain-containing protein [Nitritalea halalkaliphila]
MKKLSFIAVFFLLMGSAFAQQFSITGKIQEVGTAEGVPFANLFLLKTSDSTQLQGAVSDIDGNFRFNNVSQGEYLIRIQLLGYMSQVLEVDVQENVRLGIIPLAEEATDLSEVVVQARRPTGTVRGDTTAFNADAFKTMPDASAQTLLEKMPGIDRDGGSLQAQGETIAQILVDGKPFFGTDVAAALQNLPAEVIQSIEIFDQQSELSQMTGFDDGQRLKTINIITKPDRRKGQFGRGTAGYGSDERYLLGASVNFFDEDRRFTLTGLSNNINIQKYAADPNTQNDGNPQQGIITTNLLGFNYSDSWSEKLKVTASYTFTETENFGLESRFREFVTEEDNDQTYDENSRDVRISRRHQADMRLEYQINERNRLVYIPRFSARFENEDSGFEGITRGNMGVPLNTVENSRIGRFKDLTTFHRMFYSHKFAKEGRTLSARFRFRKSLNEDESNRVAVNTFFMENMSTEEILDQLITRERVGTMWNTRLSFTEPLGENSLLALEYGVGNRKDDSEQLLFDILSDIGPEEALLDTALSNVFFSNYFTQQYQAGYQYNTEKLRFQTELQSSGCTPE